MVVEGQRRASERVSKTHDWKLSRAARGWIPHPYRLCAVSGYRLPLLLTTYNRVLI